MSLGRIARLRAGGGDGLEAEVGEEDHRRAVDHPADAVAGVAVAGHHVPQGSADLVPHVRGRSGRRRGISAGISGDHMGSDARSKRRCR